MTEKRKELHAAIGNAIEAIYKETLDEYYGILAQHFILSENYEKGAEYSEREARKAELSTYSLYDAMTHTRRRVLCIEKMPQRDEVHKKRIDARLTLAFYLNRLNHHAEAQEAILPILDLVEKQGTKEQICRVRMILGGYHYFVEEDLLAAIQCYQEALTIAEEAKDLNILYMTSNWYGVALGFNCEFEKAMPNLKKAIEICVSVRNLSGAAIYKSNLAFLCYFLPGGVNLGFKISAEAVRIAKETGNTHPTGIAYTFYGQFLHGQGLFKEAEGYLLKADEFCGRSNTVVYLGWANVALGDNYIEMGNFVGAKGRYKRSIEVFEENQLYPSSWLALAKTGWAKAMVMNEEKDIDLESLFRLSRNIKIKAAEGWILRYIGEIVLNIDDQHTSEAENLVQKAIEADQRNGMMFHLGRDFALYAEFFKRKGNRSKAQEMLGKAIGTLKECGADGWVTKYEKELAALS